MAELMPGAAFMVSVIVKSLILIAAAACLYLFIIEIKRGRRTTRLIAWVQANHRTAWNSLPWAARKINRLGGLVHLYKRKAIADPYFAVECKAIRPFQKKQCIAFAIAAGALTVVVLGKVYWGWQF
jgi:hypothetical protein